MICGSSNYQRWYRPNDGRYLSPDPIGLAGGEAGYSAYAGGNPLVLSDPTGLARKNPNQPVCGVGQDDCEPNPLVPDEGSEPPPPPPPEERGFGGGRHIFGDRGISTGGHSALGRVARRERALDRQDGTECKGDLVVSAETLGCNVEACVVVGDIEYRECRAAPGNSEWYCLVRWAVAFAACCGVGFIRPPGPQCFGGGASGGAGADTQF